MCIDTPSLFDGRGGGGRVRNTQWSALVLTTMMLHNSLSTRFTQIRALTDTQMKWDGWIQTLSSALTMPNFTEYGWGLTHAPESLTSDIRQAIFDGLPTARSEGQVDVIEGPPALFIDRPDMTARVSGRLATPPPAHAPARGFCGPHADATVSLLARLQFPPLTPSTPSTSQRL